MRNQLVPRMSELWHENPEWAEYASVSQATNTAGKRRKVLARPLGIGRAKGIRMSGGC